MKKIILIFILIINCSSFAAEFKLDTSGTSEIEGITFNDSSKFRLYKSKGYWKASSGDYGTVKCFGTLKNNRTIVLNLKFTVNIHLKISNIL